MSEVSPTNERMTATKAKGAPHEETRNPLAAIARGAVRSADRPGGDRAALHVLARGPGADPPAAARRQSARVCRPSCVSDVSRPRARASTKRRLPICWPSLLRRLACDADEFRRLTRGARNPPGTSRRTCKPISTFVLSARRQARRRPCRARTSDRLGSRRRHRLRDDRISARAAHSASRRRRLGKDRPGGARPCPQACIQEASSRACRQRRSRDLEACSSSPTTKNARRSPGCGNGRKRRARKILSRSSNGSQAVRKLGVGADREKRIHRARYAAIARETAILVRSRHLAFRYAAPFGDAGRVRARDGGRSHRRRARHVRQDARRCLPARRPRAQGQCGRSRRRRSMRRRAPCSAWPKPCSPRRQTGKTRSPPSNARSAGSA